MLLPTHVVAIQSIDCLTGGRQATLSRHLLLRTTEFRYCKVQTLEIVANSEKAPSDVSVEAAGLLFKVSKPEFNFFANATVRILALLSPANSLLQGRSCSASLAMDVIISTAKQNILALRSDVVFGEIADTAGLPADAELPVF